MSNFFLAVVKIDVKVLRADRVPLEFGIKETGFGPPRKYLKTEASDKDEEDSFY
jgi:hypothetical protein